MAERVDPLTVSKGDRAGAVYREVSPNQLHAHRRAWSKGVPVSFNHRSQTRSAPDSGDRLNAYLSQVTRKGIEHALRYSRKGYRRRDGNDGLPDVGDEGRVACGSGADLRGRQSRKGVERISSARTDQCLKADMLARARLLFFLTLLENIDHVLDRGNAGNRFLRKRKRISHRANKLAVDVNGTAAHSGEDARAINQRTAQPRDHQTLFWARYPIQYAQDFDIKPLGLRALKYGQAVTLHSSMNLIERHQISV